RLRRAARADDPEAKAQTSQATQKVLQAPDPALVPGASTAARLPAGRPLEVSSQAAQALPPTLQASATQGLRAVLSPTHYRTRRQAHHSRDHRRQAFDPGNLFRNSECLHMSVEILSVGSDNMIRLDKLTNASTGNYVNTATVTFTLKDSTGTVLL